MHRNLSDNGCQFDPAGAAELIAQRRTDERPYFTAIGTVWRSGLQAAWQRESGQITIFLRWTRRAATDFQRGTS